MRHCFTDYFFPIIKTQHCIKCGINYVLLKRFKNNITLRNAFARRFIFYFYFWKIVFIKSSTYFTGYLFGFFLYSIPPALMLRFSWIKKKLNVNFVYICNTDFHFRVFSLKKKLFDFWHDFFYVNRNLPAIIHQFSEIRLHFKAILWRFVVCILI